MGVKAPGRALSVRTFIATIVSTADALENTASGSENPNDP